MSDTEYSLFFGGKSENSLQIKLIGLREGVTCIGVVLVRYESCTWMMHRAQFERLWMINLSDLNSKECIIERGFDKEEKLGLFVYGFKPVLNIGQRVEYFQILDSGSLERRYDSGVRLTGLKEIRFSDSTSHKSIQDLIPITSVLKLRRSLELPDTYKLHLPTEHLASNTDIALFIEKDKKMEYLVLTKARYTTFTIPKPVSSRQTYRCIFVELAHEDQSYSCHRVATQNVFTVMTKEELVKLKQKAEDYLTRTSLGTHEVKLLFRNKPKKVFEEIMNEKDGLMRKYVKDNNGDRYSPINGNIDGLFFSVSLTESETLPHFSYFGDWRLHVPVEALFTENMNLYITDFYCHGRAHYVTVVLTRPGSEADAFCRETLLLLDQMDNPFLFREDGKVLTTKSLHVEVLYTEDVDIKELQREYNKCGEKVVYFGYTSPRGNGRSTPGGIEKRRCCSVCNL